MIWWRTVSSPTFVAAKRNDPLALMVAPITSSPSRLVTGMDSPVIIDSSTADPPVHRHLLPRPDDQDVPDHDILYRNVYLLAAAHDARRFRPQPGELLYGLVGASLRPGLEQAPQQDQGDDERRGVEVHVGPPGREEPRRQGGHSAVEVGCAGAHDHKRVHVRLPVPERPPSPPVEPPSGPELYRGREHEQT